MSAEAIARSRTRLAAIPTDLPEDVQASIRETYRLLSRGTPDLGDHADQTDLRRGQGLGSGEGRDRDLEGCYPDVLRVPLGPLQRLHDRQPVAFELPTLLLQVVEQFSKVLRYAHQVLRSVVAFTDGTGRNRRRAGDPR